MSVLEKFFLKLHISEYECVHHSVKDILFSSVALSLLPGLALEFAQPGRGNVFTHLQFIVRTHNRTKLHLQNINIHSDNMLISNLVYRHECVLWV